MLGEPLVLLPGMNLTPAVWAPVLTRLAETDRPTLPLTLEGPTMDEAVAAVLAGAPARFALAGLSLGGILAMAVVRQAPERVARLALLDTNARPPTRRQRAEWAATRDALAGGRSAREVQVDLLPALLSEAGLWGPLRGQVLAMADEMGETRLDAQLAMQQTRIDERPGLAQVRVPTLVVVGELDALCPVALHEEMAGLVPEAELVVLPGVGHLTPLEAPEELARLLASWLVAEPAPARTATAVRRRAAG